MGKWKDSKVKNKTKTKKNKLLIQSMQLCDLNQGAASWCWLCKQAVLKHEAVPHLHRLLRSVVHLGVFHRSPHIAQRHCRLQSSPLSPGWELWSGIWSKVGNQSRPPTTPVMLCLSSSRWESLSPRIKQWLEQYTRSFKKKPISAECSSVPGMVPATRKSEKQDLYAFWMPGTYIFQEKKITQILVK